MVDDNPEARRRRAAKLREQIAGITKGKQDETAGEDGSEPTPRNAPRVHPLSPRQFIERRMRELDKGRDGDKKKGEGD